MLVVLPGPPVRPISMPGRRASTSPSPVAPLCSMVSRSTTDTSATTSVNGCAVRVAVTTTSFSAGAEPSWAWAVQAAMAARASAAGRSAPARKDEFIIGNQSQQGYPCRPPRQRWVIQPRTHWKPGAGSLHVGRYPGWRNTLQRLPAALVQGAQWLCAGEGIG